ncbi:hypothetical protein GCK72_022391 [Caenorhabditis remanei]|uniref:Uncharacterized protein n=1 Tax=Caenorhabditis remanei TaxID=31234 RepID=A0A6A5FTR9_CAERE|nr:hypothetical protein GCK72_022391 [Caenorhabditis remanei]KAF1745943.1 hypothetical protein GCK72_022391 [Caenorhabditis remanei]
MLRRLQKTSRKIQLTPKKQNASPPDSRPETVCKQLESPLEKKGIIREASIPLTPSNAVDVMMIDIRETSAADMWVVLHRQRIDGNLTPMMNTEEHCFLQVSVSLNDSDQMLQFLFIRISLLITDCSGSSLYNPDHVTDITDTTDSVEQLDIHMCRDLRSATSTTVTTAAAATAATVWR